MGGEALTSEMEFSVIKRLRDNIIERKKSQNGSLNRKDDDTDDLFCKTLTVDLRSLTEHSNCLAKHEIRNILFKYQMEELKKKQQRPNLTLPEVKKFIMREMHLFMFCNIVHYII